MNSELTAWRFPRDVREAAEAFCHPTEEAWREPVQWGFGLLAGCGAMLFHMVFLQECLSYPEATEGMLGSRDEIPWPDTDRFSHAPPIAGTRLREGLAKYPIVPTWIEAGEEMIFNPELVPLYPGGPLVPLAGLQLMARLPRVELCQRSGLWTPGVLAAFEDGWVYMPARFQPPNPNDAGRPAVIER